MASPKSNKSLSSNFTSTLLLLHCYPTPCLHCMAAEQSLSGLSVTICRLGIDFKQTCSRHSAAPPPYLLGLTLFDQDTFSGDHNGGGMSSADIVRHFGRREVELRIQTQHSHYCNSSLISASLRRMIGRPGQLQRSFRCSINLSLDPKEVSYVLPLKDLFRARKNRTFVFKIGGNVLPTCSRSHLRHGSQARLSGVYVWLPLDKMTPDPARSTASLEVCRPGPHASRMQNRGHAPRLELFSMWSGIAIVQG
jgi:hypothetical protein